MNQSVTGQMIQGKIIEENTWLRTTPNYWAIPGFVAGNGSACSVNLLLGKSTLNKVCRWPATTVTFAVAAPLLESINLSPKCQFATRLILIGYFPSHLKAVSSIEKGTIRYIHPGTPELQHRTWHRDMHDRLVDLKSCLIAVKWQNTGSTLPECFCTEGNFWT